MRSPLVAVLHDSERKDRSIILQKMSRHFEHLGWNLVRSKRSSSSRCRPEWLHVGLRLLGFKDSSELAFEDNIKHSQFIYPNEKAFTGSTRTFHALLKTMIAKEKIALCLGLFRRNSSPYFYVMVPQVHLPYTCESQRLTVRIGGNRQREWSARTAGWLPSHSSSLCGRYSGCTNRKSLPR